jgi:curved DNA-binding protein CbpA
MTQDETIIAAFVTLECEPGCALDEVKASFRQLVKVWHPDRFDGDSKLKIKATEKMKSINDAYRLLERFYEELHRHGSEEQLANTPNASTGFKASASSGQTQARQANFEVGSEEVTITKERDPKTGHTIFRKVVENVKNYDGRWLSTRTTVFTTKPVASGESFESASKHSMSFSLSPEQGRKGKHCDYGSDLRESEHDGTGNEYLFLDGSSVYIANVSTDTWFNDDNKKATHGRFSLDLGSMTEAFRIFKRRRDWVVCVEIGQRAIDLHGQNAWGWIQRSIALNGLKKTREAFDLLKPAANMFPSDTTVFYNLACYASLLGNTNEARHWLNSVFELAKRDGPHGWAFEHYREMALKDSDLGSVRDAIPQAPLSWKIRKYFGV